MMREPKMREPKKKRRIQDRSPYERRSEKVTSDGFKAVDKSVKPVAKDTNKTRRPIRKPL